VAGDRSARAAERILDQFQSTPACGGRRRKSSKSPRFQMFQSTPACGGRHRTVRVLRVPLLFQSTPACGGRQNLARTRRTLNMFQSTPACGGRHPCHGSGRVSVQSFNPRPRVAGDTSESSNQCYRKVSIHARVWRATSIAGNTLTATPGFNPRPRVAGDSSIASLK